MASSDKIGNRCHRDWMKSYLLPREECLEHGGFQRKFKSRNSCRRKTVRVNINLPLPRFETVRVQPCNLHPGIRRDFPGVCGNDTASSNLQRQIQRMVEKSVH